MSLERHSLRTLQTLRQRYKYVVSTGLRRPLNASVSRNGEMEKEEGTSDFGTLPLRVENAS